MGCAAGIPLLHAVGEHHGSGEDIVGHDPVHHRDHIVHFKIRAQQAQLSKYGKGWVGGFGAWHPPPQSSRGHQYQKVRLFLSIAKGDSSTVQPLS